MTRWLGVLALVCFAVHASFHVLSGRAPDVLWACHIAALLIGVGVGVLLSVLESNGKLRNWVPSPTGIGIGILVPGSAVITMFTGAVVGELWKKVNRAGYEARMVPVAAGFIAGEAIIAVLIPILVSIGIVHLQ